jgi:hypothetical protein
MANKKFSGYGNNPTPEDNAKLLFENQAATNSYNYTFIQLLLKMTRQAQAYIDTETWNETIAVTTDGQTSFTISNVIDSPNTFKLFYQGILYGNEGVDYTITGSSLTWLDPDGVTLRAGADFRALYFYTGI